MVTPCIPPTLPIVDLDWQKLVPLVGDANASLARYDGQLTAMVNPAILLSPLTTREAVLSSKIEGTQVTVGEVLQHEAGQKYDQRKTDDIFEVLNYRKALLTGEQYVRDRPISLSLIRELHAMLLTGVRGQNKTPGAFRTDQNWIGKRESPIEEARFVPPSPVILQEHLDKWERYLALEGEDPVIQSGVMHAQFEILHPFGDGNGRVGRMLIPLFLHRRNRLERPMFYMSEFFESNRENYHDALLAITDDNDWQGWIELFLRGVIETATLNSDKAKRILELYNQMKLAFPEITHSQYAMTALDTFFARPIINSSDFLRLSNIHTRPTASVILGKLSEAGVISILMSGSGRTPTTYAFPALLRITEGDDFI